VGSIANDWLVDSVDLDSIDADCVLEFVKVGVTTVDSGACRDDVCSEVIGSWLEYSEIGLVLVDGCVVSIDVDFVVTGNGEVEFDEIFDV